MKSRIHPNYKARYRVGHWPEYDKALVQRGDLTLWISEEAIAAWVPEPSGKRGGQPKYSDLAIETALVLRLVFHLPLRQTEGFPRSVVNGGRKVQRGDITIWISEEALAAWAPKITGRRGGQPKYSDLAIETALVLRLIYHLPLRQTEGFVRSVLRLMEFDLEAPDHTTLSRRGRHLSIELRPPGSRRGRHLIVDTTGLSIVGEGEWAAAKHVGKGVRGWKKLHLCVDEHGAIVAEELTSSSVDDAGRVPELLGQIDGRINRFVADGAYDERPVHEAGRVKGAVVVVPPSRTAVRAQQRSAPHPARDRVIAHVRRVGLRQWKKERGWHQQARAENAVFRYKRIIGPSLRARDPEGREVEARLVCSILNRMTEMGRPASYAVR